MMEKAPAIEAYPRDSQVVAPMNGVECTVQFVPDKLYRAQLCSTGAMPPQATSACVGGNPADPCGLMIALYIPHFGMTTALLSLPELEMFALELANVIQTRTSVQ